MNDDDDDDNDDDANELGRKILPMSVCFTSVGSGRPGVFSYQEITMSSLGLIQACLLRSHFRLDGQQCRLSRQHIACK